MYNYYLVFRKMMHVAHDGIRGEGTGQWHACLGLHGKEVSKIAVFLKGRGKEEGRRECCGISYFFLDSRLLPHFHLAGVWLLRRVPP
jgi:hypothetical protein